MDKYDYTQQTITIVGLGATGLSCVEYLQHKAAKLQVIDTRVNPPNSESIGKDIDLWTGSLNLDWLLASDLIVLSPGVALQTPEIQQALAKGIPIVGDIELFCRVANKPIIAITGSNGKSTVTTLVAEMVAADGKKVGMGGNIGIPALSLLNSDCDIYVLELSSFQLETTFSLQTAVATVLNITEDHMNRYASFTDYKLAKHIIYKNCNLAVFNAEDPLTKPISVTQPSVSFGENSQDYYLQDSQLMAHGQSVINISEMQITGRHNYLNALAAIALADGVGLSRVGIKQALKQYTGLTHRFQKVATNDGVCWINDSKATNVGSTVAALNGLDCKGSLYLLLGGDGKDADFSELIPLINHAHIHCYCFGQDGRLLAELSPQSVVFETMQQAISSLKPKLKAGDIVLLSPACASWDQFANFEVRGMEFVRLAQL